MGCKILNLEQKESQAGHPFKFDEFLMALPEENSALSVEELKIKLRSSHTTVYRHLQ